VTTSPASGPAEPPRAIAARAAGPSERTAAALRAAVVGGIATAVVTAAHLLTLPRLPLCAFKAWTGLPCPGCGMTRSVFRFAQGDLWTSFRFHPLGVAGATLALSVLAGGVIGAVTGRDPVWPRVARRGSAIALAFVFGLIGLWVVRAFLVPQWSPEAVDAALASTR